MSERVVYDAMIFYQWAALPAGRSHGTINALERRSARLCLSPDLLREVRELLNRPAIRGTSPNLTSERIDLILEAARQYADWFPDVPKIFSLTAHPKDDHVFNLCIYSAAKYLVTWEERILKLGSAATPDAQKLRSVAPQLQIVTPAQFAKLLKPGIA